MKRLLCSSLALLLLFTSCKKDKDEKEAIPDNTVEATLNGTKLSFTVESATLLRDAQYDAKRLDINCVSTDKKHRVILTIGNYVLEGNGMEVKTYNIALSLVDDPATPDIDESMNETDDGLFTYSTKLGENNWLTDVYTTLGKIVVTANNATDKTISGTFEMELKDWETQKSEFKFTAGKFSNVKYMVLN
ncbi:MAG: hypothetical protein J7578_08805 [Chitinophagaceae bacterium]|nr:hypothetical protein [Chitinophagaceae bacterium]